MNIDNLGSVGAHLMHDLVHSNPGTFSNKPDELSHPDERDLALHLMALAIDGNWWGVADVAIRLARAEVTDKRSYRERWDEREALRRSRQMRDYYQTVLGSVPDTPGEWNYVIWQPPEADWEMPESLLDLPGPVVYVGVTCQPKERLRTHVREWMVDYPAELHAVWVGPFDRRADAEESERRLIHELRPERNKTLN